MTWWISQPIWPRRNGGNGNQVRGIYSTIFTLDEVKDDVDASHRQYAPHGHSLEWTDIREGIFLLLGDY
jgi:hypothetical protein